jgi:hypothetical protein
MQRLGTGLGWIPAFAGMTMSSNENDAFFLPVGQHFALTDHLRVIPAKAGIHVFRLLPPAAQREKARHPQSNDGLVPCKNLTPP